MEIILIILIALIAVIIIVFGVVSHIKKIEREKYYMAAGNIIREDFLNYSLQNPANYDGGCGMPSGQRTMLYIKSKTSGKKSQFVFDPEKRILIGRDRFNSNIYINEAFVSQHHCSIFFRNNQVFLQDMNSANGTYVKRGLFKKYFIVNGQYIQLRSKDRIIIGSNKFKIILFFYDMSMM